MLLEVLYVNTEFSWHSNHSSAPITIYLHIVVWKLKICPLEFLIDLVLNVVCVFIGHRAGLYFVATISNENAGWGDQLHKWEAQAGPGGVHQMWEGLHIVARNARFHSWELRPLHGGNGDGDCRSQPIFRASGGPEPHHVTIGWQTCKKIVIVIHVVQHRDVIGCMFNAWLNITNKLAFVPLVQGSGDFWAQPAKIRPFTTSTGFFQDLTGCKLVAIHLDRPISYIFFKCRLISSSL